MAPTKWLYLLLFCLVTTAEAAQQDRAELVKKDLANFEDDKYWIYNDLDRGIAQAKETRRPLLVVFR